MRVACRRCGEFPLDLSDLVLRLCEDDLAASYRFRCPCCGLVQLEEAGISAAGALLEAEVDTEWWSLPDRSAEHPHGQPISADDLEVAHLVLHDDARLAAEVATLQEGAAADR